MNGDEPITLPAKMLYDHLVALDFNLAELLYHKDDWEIPADVLAKLTAMHDTAKELIVVKD
jgi:hypothetical protein